MNIVLFGTADFANPALEKLLEAGHRVMAVVTQPDRPAGRGRELQASPVPRSLARDAGRGALSFPNTLPPLCAGGAGAGGG